MTSRSGRQFGAAGVLVFLTALLALPAAARAQTAVVPAFPCAVIFGGQWTVPAGSGVVISFPHRVLDGFTVADETSHRPLFFGPGITFEFPCEVTGD